MKGCSIRRASALLHPTTSYFASFDTEHINKEIQEFSQLQSLNPIELRAQSDIRDVIIPTLGMQVCGGIDPISRVISPL